MQVSKEFLLEAVGLSLLVGLMLLGVQMFDRAKTLMEVLNRGQEQKIEELQEYEITQYENRTIDGITAANYIKTMVHHYDLKVLVETDGRGFVIESRESCKKLTASDSEYYLNPFAVYSCTILKDENGTIEYVQIKAEEGESDE